MAAQFYPKFYTMIPAGLMVGIGAGPLWCAKCTYLTVAAEAYSTLSNVAADVLVTRFFGVFFMFYQMAQVWGNLISSAGEYRSAQSRWGRSYVKRYRKKSGPQFAFPWDDRSAHRFLGHRSGKWVKNFTLAKFNCDVDDRVPRSFIYLFFRAKQLTIYIFIRRHRFG